MHALLSTKQFLLVGLCILVCVPALAASTPAGGQWTALTMPDNSFAVWILRDDQPVMRTSVDGWGPRWSWVPGPRSTDKAAGGVLQIAAPFTIDKDQGQVINVSCRAQQSGDRSVAWRYELSADRDVPLIMLMVGFTMGGAGERGRIVATLSDGSERPITLPVPRAPEIAQVSKLAFQLTDAGEVNIALDPACDVGLENSNLRVMLTHGVFKQGKAAVTMTWTFPGPVRFLGSEEDQAQYVKAIAGPDWFEFAPENDNGPSVVSMNDWLDAPAGKHGGVRMVGDGFQFEDGTPVKFWGTNLSYALCAPEQEGADATAARFAKYGVNGVRLHKFCGPSGWEGIADREDATKFDPKGLERLDYFCSKLTEEGVYYGFSHTFGFKPAPGNKDALLAYDEIATNLKGSTYGLINIAPDVQDLMIQMVVNLLKHRNPHTGKTYAEDPTLSFIELQNEDDIFFYTTDGILKSCPTYHKRLVEQFSDWLKEKYGSREALAAAWLGSLKAAETLDARNIGLQGNPWYVSDNYLPGTGPGERRRMLDNAAFFHDVQNAFYSRFVRAIREAGYEGPLVGSPWQAPTMVPHYYNLRSDYLVGYIDRHNYAGGRGKIFYTMLGSPGSGYFGSGLQQVADRPFGLSEWVSVYPSLYSAEGPAVIAAYGMGLQGWDCSYEFQSFSNRPGLAEVAGTFPWGVWEVDVPTQIGQFPALARMVLRGDVEEGPVISARRVSLPELREGEFSFSDRVTQSGDVKVFEGTVPPQALAAGRVVVEFTDGPQPSTFPDMTRYQRDSVITSATGQLTWDSSDKGLITVNTAGTVAVVGFAEGRTVQLGDVDVTVQCPYASLFLTALEKDAKLADARRALLSAVARNCNSGFQYFAPDGRVLDNGAAPILLEPVKARVRLAGRQIAAVNVLDHDGRVTGRTLPVADGAFTIDGARDKAIYYEVVFK